MANVNPSQDSFVKGEISPRLHARASLELYRSALGLCENFVTLPHGGLRKRSGTYYADETKNSAIARPIRFIFSETQAYCLLFSDLNFRVYAYGGPVEDGDSVVEVETPYAEADIADLQFRQSGDVLYVTHPDYDPRKITRSSNTDWSIAVDDHEDGPFGTENTDRAITMYVSAPAAARVITDITQDSPGVVESVGHGFVAGQSVTIADVEGMTQVNGNTYIVTPIDADTFSINVNTASYSAYTSGGTATGPITITANEATFTAEMVGQLIKINVNTFETWKPWDAGAFLQVSDASGVLRRYDGNIYEAIEPTSVTGKIRTGGTPPTHLSGAEWDGGGEEGELVDATPAHNENVGVKWQYKHSGFGVARITAVAGDGLSATATVLTEFPGEVVGSSNAAYRWSVGGFGGEDGFPRSVTIFEERLIYGQKFSVYGSKTFDFRSFRAGAADDDALAFQLVGTEAITWLEESDGFLIAGTIGGVRALSGGGNNEPLTPSSFKNRGSPTKRCSSLPPVKAGSTFVYVGFDRKSLAEMTFSLEKNGFGTQPLGVISEHIPKRGITSLAFQSETDPFFWMGLNTGELGGLTYEADQNVRGFHRQKLGGSFGSTPWGIVEYVEVTPGQAGSDDVWLVVKRTINGVTRRYLEVMQPPFEYGDIEDAFFVDCGLTYDGSPINAVSGASHLSGERVNVLADGMIYKSLLVQDGIVTLPGGATASKIHLGLPYVAAAETLELDVGGRDGSVMGRKKRVNSVILSVLETANIYVKSLSRNTFELHKAGKATIVPESDNISLFTGNLDPVLIDDSWAGNGRIRIEAPDPVPCTVRAMITTFDSEGS